MPRKSRFPKKARAKTTKKQTKNWFQQIPLGVKIFLGLLLVAIGVVTYWQIRAALRRADVNVTVTSSRTGLFSTQATSQVHILFHVYRANPDIVARSVFAAFEAAKYPGLIHVHIFQELSGDDCFERDVFDAYKQNWARLHSCDLQSDRNIHVVNENPTQSAGQLISLLTLTQESVLPILGANDIIISGQSFYDAPGTHHLFPLTFAQDYDELLRNNNLDGNTIYSGKLPRTSMSAASAAQVTTLTSSLTHAIGYNVVIPFLKSKEHSRFLESRITGVCSAAAARNLNVDQVGFVSYTTSDRIANISARQNTVSDTPFTVFRFMRDFYAPASQSDTINWTEYSGKHANALLRPVPIVGLHEDIIICNSSTWSQLTNFARTSGRSQLFPTPEYLHTLMLSNLVYAAGINMLSCNHLPIAAVFDHLTGASATTDPKTLRNAQVFEPHNWLIAMRPVNEDETQYAPVKLSDPCDLIKLDSKYEWYAGVTVDNVTQEGFLGITAQDGPNIIQHKFSSGTELDRQRRMLAAIQYPLRT